MSGLVVFLGGEMLPWLRVEDGAIIERGEDLAQSGETVTAIAPASGLTFRVATFTDLSPAQALAAARLEAADASLGSDRHVVVADAGDHYVVTDKAAMQGWLAQLAEHGLTATSLIPAPSLLPVPETGFVRVELPGETMLRSAKAALAEDGTISALIVGDAPVRTLGRSELERAIATAAISPPLDLLHGDFAARADWGAASGYWRHLATLSSAIVVLTLAIPLAQWVRISMSTSALDRQSATIAAKALGEARASDDAVERMQQRLVAQRGGGAGFLATQAAVASAVESTPNVELASLSFDSVGTLRATIRASGRPELDALRNAIGARGFAVTEGAPTTTQGRAEVEFQVRPR